MLSFPARSMDTCARTSPRTGASFGTMTRSTTFRRSTEFPAVEAPSTGQAPLLLGAWFSSIPDTHSLDRCPATFFSRLGSTEETEEISSVVFVHTRTDKRFAPRHTSRVRLEEIS